MNMHISLIRHVMPACFAIAALGGCATYDGPARGPHAYPAHVKIPPGHMPPPGECRIWYPDAPPGQQPPPGKCRDLERRVPPGAILVRG